jgi:ADP-ribosylation factor GTPase-activating protein 2/3
VVITDAAMDTSTDGTTTPAGEPVDDFFSSWDKPTIKRPSNPPSRTGTPPVATRTASPFLSANANGTSTTRSKSPSPLAATEPENHLPAPVAVRTTTSSAIRKGPTFTGPKRANILGAKKGQKLGAKKAVGEEIDFEEVEKRAKEEAERIEKLGYDPEAEKAEETSKPKATAMADRASIIAPTPINPPKSGYSAQPGHQRSPSEIERLGMGMNRLGFGQIGGQKPTSTAAVPSKLGFGSVGTSKATDGNVLAQCKSLAACYLPEFR